jgi:hypothetical protein
MLRREFAVPGRERPIYGPGGAAYDGKERAARLKDQLTLRKERCSEHKGEGDTSNRMEGVT